MTIKDNNITRTVIADLLQTNMMAGIPHPIYSGTSLNELLNILPNAVVPAGKYPTFGYYAIGDYGHTLAVSGSGDDVVVDLFKHQSTDNACWRQIPFVMRPEGNDLTETQRQLFAGRRLEKWNDINYWCYYLCRCDVKALQAKVIEYTTIAGNVVPNAYNFDGTNLRPTRPSVPPDQVVAASDKYMAVSLPFAINFNEFLAQELVNVATVRYGNPKRAIVSEVLLLAGIDYTLQTTTDNAAPISFKEAIAIQALTHLSTYHQMNISTEGFTINLELGCNEPLNADDGGSASAAQQAALIAARTMNVQSFTTTAN